MTSSRSGEAPPNKTTTTPPGVDEQEGHDSDHGDDIAKKSSFVKYLIKQGSILGGIGADGREARKARNARTLANLKKWRAVFG